MRIPQLLVCSAALLAGTSGLACAAPRRHEAPVFDDAAPPSAKDAAAPSMRAGAAKVDITPLPGVPLGGHSLEGGTGYGLWNRLWARAVYIEDPHGEPLVLVVADLWGIPAGLADDVVEHVRADHDLRQLGRAQVLISATHTHHGPANFASDKFYSRAVGPQAGFDPELRDFLARRIAAAIAAAAAASQPAQLRLDSARVPLIARNRSLPPFLENPEAPALLAANADLPTCPEYPREVEGVDPCQAVDPTLTTLRIEDAAGRPLAVAAFFSAHPTAMLNATDVYSGDFFAVATARAEAALAARWRAQGLTHADPVVALFNGPEGDVSPNWQTQGRQTTLELGQRLAAAIVDSARLEAEAPVENAPDPCRAQALLGAIESGFIRQPMADQPVEGPPRARTAARALPGKSMLAGAEDGPTRFRPRIHEGHTVTRHRRAGQGPKQPAVPPMLFWLGFPRETYAQTVPLSIHRLGPLTIAGLPGEFTTVMGARIRARIARDDPPSAPRPLLIGLAGEYISYFVTPQEYALQHYEGGSTLWGQYAGTLIAERLGTLSAKVGRGEAGLPEGSPGLAARDRPGRREHFALRSGPRARRVLDDLPDRLHRQLQIEAPIEALPRLQFETAVPNWSDAQPWPEIEVQRRDEAGAWQTLLRGNRPVDQRGEEFLIFPVKLDDTRWIWEIWWIDAPPEGERLRLRARGFDGRERCSGEFETRDDRPTPDIRGYPCAAHYKPRIDPRDGFGVHRGDPSL
ncbi:neutral/alkaline non-lysosomal ceramidase N-terminal domain-containing protein [Pseudenhygromyxa sp. WMMC2535]|uniref:neutral/alkaline non-lysosomal ceramidase N-terminal domain-containing protein n=1 Tax=Pseudenhygromyxa sp. WMMC2535 TaxID=2712867 RepID=UPI001555E7AD|nr:neutral/alkaline non-lysosomal ceramidase N-terminal domain-containing protein [Pseudenhygromyxa sp. WMMC2535]NVB36273.1 neutral/alkaline non-lysosomal ceramidase N-terminal domain-containing protein [Pseudenhygromyxa sp. WMMC2535]